MVDTSLLIIGADHRGFALKEQLLEWLHEQWTVEDQGAFELKPDDDYPQIAAQVARAVAAQTGAKGVLVCGSGIGVAIAANKCTGIRAGHGTSASQVEEARDHLDLNVLTLGADEVSLDQAKSLIQTFMSTPFSGAERHQRRLDTIAALET